MELTSVASELKWDKERLGELYDHLSDERGATIARGVIQRVCPVLADCPDIPGVKMYLSRRNLLQKADFNKLSREDASGEQLSDVLIHVSWESIGRAKFLIRNLILSLLDMFLDRCHIWCHSVAFCLRREAIEQLHLPQELTITRKTDLTGVNIPDAAVVLSNITANSLLQKLSLPPLRHRGDSIDLRVILTECCNSQKSMFDVVRTMMLTPGVGRHVSKLAPFYQSYPVEVLLFLKSLVDGHWVKFARFIGFVEEEVKQLQDLSQPGTKEQVQSFSKVWRMPDLTSSKNDEVLDEMLQTAKIRKDKLTQEAGASPSSGVTIISQGPLIISGSSQDDSYQSVPLTGEGSPLTIQRDLHEQRSVQNTGSGDYSQDSDIHPLVQEMRGWTGTSDVNESLSSLPSVRPESVPSDPWSLSSSHPTSAPAMQALHSGHSEEAQYVVPPPPVHFTEVPTFSSGDTVTATSSLGRGLYGDVQVCQLQPCGAEYAAKRYQCQPEFHKLKDIFFEKLNGLKNVNVVTSFGVCHLKSDSCSSRPALVMERFHRNLATFLQDPNLPLQTKRSILCDVANGLAYLHERSVIHCDLTAQNILMTSDDTAKIADHANSLVECIADKHIPTKSPCLDYLPEEAWEDYDSSVDVFSFGHLAIYIILQEKPYPLLPRKQKVEGTYRALSELKRREAFIPLMHEKISDTSLSPLLEYTKKCLSDEPDERPPITALKSTIMNTS